MVRGLYCHCYIVSILQIYIHRSIYVCISELLITPKRHGTCIAIKYTEMTSRICQNKSNRCKWGTKHNRTFWISSKNDDKPDGLFSITVDRLITQPSRCFRASLFCWTIIKCGSSLDMWYGIDHPCEQALEYISNVYGKMAWNSMCSKTFMLAKRHHCRMKRGRGLGWHYMSQYEVFRNPILITAAFNSPVNILDCMCSNWVSFMRGSLFQAHCCSWYGFQTCHVNSKCGRQLGVD